MRKTSQGPWVARIDETATLRDMEGNQLAIFTHLNTRTGGRRDSDEVAANARLAAAAPDLLEVARHCEEMLRRYEINRINGEEIADEALGKIRAAIAKATGANNG